MKLFGLMPCGHDEVCGARRLPNAKPPVDFDSQIQPILSDRCFLCHGPDANKRQADLRLDREADAKDYAIIPGKPDESELFRRITSDDPAERMPPPQSKLSLTKEEIQLIKRWIEQGANWQDHWAFIPPRAAADSSKSKTENGCKMKSMRSSCPGSNRPA